MFHASESDLHHDKKSYKLTYLGKLECFTKETMASAVYSPSKTTWVSKGSFLLIKTMLGTFTPKRDALKNK